MLSIRAEGGGCEGVTSVCDVCDNGRLLDGSVCVIPGAGGVGRRRSSEQGPLQAEGSGG